MRPPILHVAPALWSGAGSVITRLAEAQSQRGPVIVTTSSRRGLERDWPEYRRRLRAAGVAHRSINLLTRDRHDFVQSVARLVRLIDAVRPAVVHAHAGVPSLAAVLASASARERPLVIGQMYSWGPDRPEWMNIEDTLGFSATDRVICSSRTYCDVLRGYGVAGHRLVYLPWGLSLGDLPWGTPSWDGSQRPPRLGFLGRIEPRKNQLQLIKLLPKVQRHFPGASLELVGPVADRDYARSIAGLIARDQITGVTMTGQLAAPTERVRKWDLFVSLSADEGQGLAVLEAMALGVPVAARPVAGLSDFLVGDRNGTLLQARTNRGMAETIVGALSQPATLARMARRARRLVEERYDWRATVRAFDSLYGFTRANAHR
jgi:glycosyltransferase involved in cell wall biosynthesis